ncbi:hypothetical protein TSUD_332120 [Trifolium subterraneum]|uniref:Secreted protein n=1 Tax=Trifolium subterraneum TaxID=3900 RepID=A0A2Z6MJQ5_TRISU|nr:hypothetical protein TSUD_332120 [Trifolium subterraneum]
MAIGLCQTDACLMFLVLCPVSIVCRVNSKIDESHHFPELSKSQLSSLTFYQERKRQGRVTSLFLLYTQSKDVHGSAQHGKPSLTNQNHIG